MRDLALQAAGALAILTAIVHGAIAELRVFTNARIEPRGTRKEVRKSRNHAEIPHLPGRDFDTDL